MATLLFELGQTHAGTNPIYPSFICETCFDSNSEWERSLGAADCFRPNSINLGMNESCPLCNASDTRMVFLRRFYNPTLLVSIREILNLLNDRTLALGRAGDPYDYAQHDYNKTVLLISDLTANGFLTYLPESRAAMLNHIHHLMMNKKEILSLVDRIQLGVMNSINHQETLTLSPTGTEVHYNAAINQKYRPARSEFRSVYGFPYSDDVFLDAPAPAGRTRADRRMPF